MSKLKNLVGMKFGRLTVIERAENDKHGLAHTPIYNLWAGIKNRCTNPNELSYKNYGGRGITMFEDWIDNFQAFYDYVSTLPHCLEPGYTLDRIDNDGDYCPENLRFVDRKTQARNKRNNVIIEYNGENRLLIEVAEITGIPYTTLKKRYHDGDRGDKLFRPTREMMLHSDLLLIENNQVLTTSRIIAEKFGKRHDRVLRAIENELANLREIADQTEIDAAFIKGEYKDKKGEIFFQVVLGFTGKEASKLRWKYIQEFNRMETLLKK